MPKVFTNSSKGLVQKSGSGIDIDALEDGMRLKASTSGSAISLKAKSIDLTLANGDTTTASTGNFIPAGSKLVAASILTSTAGAGGNTINVTKFGLDGDDDYWATGITHAANTADAQLVYNGEGLGAAAPITGYFAAADEVLLTHGDPGSGTTQPVITVTIWYYDLSATAPVTAN